MGYKYKAAPKSFSDAAGTSSVLNFPPKKSEAPARTFLFAFPGGGSLTQAQAGAIPAVYETITKYGIVTDITGTSGGSINGLIIANALNRGLGLPGIIAGLNQFWLGPRKLDSTYGVSRMQKWFRTASDKQGNLPQAYVDLTKVFGAAAIGQMGIATTKLKDMLDVVVGHDYHYVQNGPVRMHTNYVTRNIYSGRENYVISSGKDIDGDEIVSSCGLDELGCHIRYRDINFMNLMTGNIHMRRDGAYRVNPELIAPIESGNPTDVVIISLHAPSGKPKDAYESKIHTHEIHDDIEDLKLRYPGIRFHVLQIDFPPHLNASSHMNTDPDFLDELKALGEQQAIQKMPALIASLEGKPQPSLSTGRRTHRAHTVADRAFDTIAS